MANIYEITSDYQRLMDMATDMENGEVSEEAFFTAWEDIDSDFEAKAEGYAMVMKNLESDIVGIKTEIDRLTNRKKAYENAVIRMKATLQMAMKTTEKVNFQAGTFKFAIQKNPMSLADPIADVPEEFLIPQEPKFAKSEAKDAVKSAYCKARGIDEKDFNKADIDDINEFCKENFAFAEFTQGESLRIR